MFILVTLRKNSGFLGIKVDDTFNNDSVLMISLFFSECIFQIDKKN